MCWLSCVLLHLSPVTCHTGLQMSFILHKLNVGQYIIIDYIAVWFSPRETIIREYFLLWVQTHNFSKIINFIISSTLWHVTCDIQKLWTMSEHVRSLALTIWEERCFEDFEENRWVNYLMNALIIKVFVEHPWLQRVC